MKHSIDQYLDGDYKNKHEEWHFEDSEAKVKDIARYFLNLIKTMKKKIF